MSDDTRETTGPLSERQRLIIKRLAEGKTHQQIGSEIGISRAYVGRIVSNSLTPKMGACRPTAAIAQYGRSEGLKQAAEELLKWKPRGGNEVDDHVSYVLEILAVKLRRSANDLVP